jgi:hypothetical protein
MWNVTNVIRVLIETTGIDSKSFIKYLNKVLVKHQIKEVQQSAVLGTAHTFRKVQHIQLGK